MKEMTDDRKELDRKVGDALRSYREEAPAELFARIEQTLATGGADRGAAAGKRKRLHRSRGYGVAAALLAGVLVTALYLGRPTGVPEDATARVTSPSVTEKPLVPAPGTAVREACTAPAEGPAGAPRSRNAHPQREALAANGTPAEATVRPDSSAGNDRTDASEGQPDGRKEETAPRPATPSATATAPHPDRRRPSYRPTPPYSGDRPHRIPVADRERHFAQAYRRTNERNERFSGSLYAGNFGTLDGHTVTHDPDRVASAGMLIKQAPDGGMTLQSGLHEENGRPILAPTEPAMQEVRLQHRMPLTVGVSLSVPLNERLALATGLSYSYLRSSSDLSSATGDTHITRELHYIGIPLGLTYTFYRTGRFGFYLHGGGMIEKGVVWRETHGFANAGDSSRESTLRSIRGIQLSVSAAAGLSYDIGDRIGLYAEPGIGYYFGQKDQPASYRTAHPTNFSLRVGIRFGL